jgi:4-amino-4-deoxy-L-arabinose transferase-like glycosyltransferase
MSATAFPGRLTRPDRTAIQQRLRGLVRGDVADATWVRPALIALLAVTAIAYTLDLTASGYANSFYAAAVQAGTKSWKALFFGSLDSSNFITVDKPPASLWVMALSGRIFGFSSASMLIPEVVEGLAAVALLYGAVKRAFSAEAGLLAGLLLALTPVAALMFRFNNPDALMVCLNVAAAYFLVRALEKGQTRWLVFCGMALGFAFLSKMLEAWLVLPGFALVYFSCAPVSLKRRVGQLSLGGAAMIASCGWWLAAVELWPTASRPMIDGSPDNNIFNLIFGYNGLGRVFGSEVGGGGAAGGSHAGFKALGGAGKPVTSGGGAFAGGGAGGAHAFAGRGGGGAGGSFSGNTGILRLFNDLMGGQASWLIPAAVISLIAGLWFTRRAPRTDKRRANLMIWGSWLLVMGLTFSFSSGIIHTYYTVALVPAISALAAIGAVTLWKHRQRLGVRVLACVSILVTAGWAIVLLSRDSSWEPWLVPLIAVTAIAAVVWMMMPPFGRYAQRITLTLAAIACLAGPLAYTTYTLATPHTGTIPTAGPGSSGSTSGSTPVNASGKATTRAAAGVSSGGPGDVTVSKSLEQALEHDAGKYRWVAATSGSQSAAQMELATGGDPVMAIGGFDGEGGNVSLATFKQYVESGKIHYYVVSSGGFGGGAGGAGGGGRSGFGASTASGSGRSAVSSLFGGSSAGGGASTAGSGFPGRAGGGFAGGGAPGSSSSDSTILNWVKAHFKKETVGGQTVYNLTQAK